MKSSVNVLIINLVEILGMSSKSVSWPDGEVGDPPCFKMGNISRLVPRSEKGPQSMH